MRISDWSSDVCSSDLQMVTGPLAALTMMKAVFPLMEGRDGRILNFGSAAGFQGTVGMTPYNMAKEAIRALTRPAAREWGDKRVTVNSLCPVPLTESFQSALDQGLPEVAPSPSPPIGAHAMATIPKAHMSRLQSPI